MSLILITIVNYIYNGRLQYAPQKKCAYDSSCNNWKCLGVDDGGICNGLSQPEKECRCYTNEVCSGGQHKCEAVISNLVND